MNLIRRALVAAAVVLTVSVAFANQNATLVLKSGERISGQMSYGGGADLQLNAGGQLRTFPLNDIAIVAFVPGDPSAAEINQLPERDDDVELRRHMITLRDGSIVHGKFYKFSPSGDVTTIDTAPGQRRDIPSDQIARLYLAGATARSLYSNVAAASGAVPTATSGTLGTATVTVNAAQPWSDSGIVVRKGDNLSFQTTGQVQVAPGAAATPDGFAGDTGARRGYPVAAAPAGALIGRIGSGAPFPIGSNSQPITMPANGRLYVGINDSNFSDNSGAFTVRIVR